MKPAISLFGLLMLSPLAAAEPTTVYKWVDADGLTHYGEAPPDTTTAQRMELEPAPPSTDLDRNLYSVIQQAQRMERQRLERERLRAEAEAARAETQRQAAEEAAALAAAEFYEQQPVPAPTRIYAPYPVPPRGHFGPPPRWHHERHPPPPGVMPRHYSGRHPAFTPPDHWLRNHPRLWRKVLRAHRDHHQSDRQR